MPVGWESCRLQAGLASQAAWAAPRTEEFALKKHRERFRRVCHQHNRPVRFVLGMPFCVKGNHAVETWAVLDTQENQIVAGASLDAVCVAFEFEGLPTHSERQLASPRGQLNAVEAV